MKKEFPANAKPVEPIAANPVETPAEPGQTTEAESPPASEQPPAAATEPETVASQPAAPANVAELVNPPLPSGKGKGNRSLADYARLDWSKTNGELAKIANVSRERIRQIRLQIENGEHLTQDPGETVSQVEPTAAAAPTVEPTIAQAAADYKLLAATTFDMSAGLLTMLVGPEWQPRILEGPNGSKINERDLVCGALERYYAAKQMPDLPPGVMLTFVLCSYAAPRFTEPQTKAKIKLGWNWAKVKLATLFKRRKRPAAIETAAEPKETTNNDN